MAQDQTPTKPKQPQTSRNSAWPNKDSASSEMNQFLQQLPKGSKLVKVTFPIDRRK